MSCFEIAHLPEAESLFSNIHRGLKQYFRAKPLHPICEEVVEAYTQDVQLQ